ncbi:MAG: endonuclease/exonuclease/phosphatase family protein [Verrucomicrobiota bacterium]|nr:endonuclease/exonuclease/phosphatase family protein [Verrucomicrobiota bacterium]
MKTHIAASLLLALAATGHAREFSVMTYNLRRFTLDDRDGDGKKNDPKPDNECRALARIIAKASPDILAVQEIGGKTPLNAFQAWLKTEGLEYPHVEMLQRGDRDSNLAVLSRFPIVESTHHTNEWYSIGKARLAVARGFHEAVIQVDGNYRFHLVNAHLKSKIYSPLGQTEMRRNEARLLNKVVRRILEKNPGCKLLVVGDMNDNPNSAAIREVAGKSKKNLFDLRPAEPGGDAWTHHHSAPDIHSRLDYIFANAKMLGDSVPEKSFVVRAPATYIASDHRPVLAVFSTDHSTE